MLTKLANLNLLGWDVTGDVGGYTTYQSERRKIVVFPRSPPLNPPTPAQECVRDLFRNVAAWWRDCPAEYKANVQKACNAAGLRITGYNLCTWTARTGDSACWETICRQAGIDLEPPPYIGIENPG